MYPGPLADRAQRLDDGFTDCGLESAVALTGDVAILFGKETAGLPEALREKYRDRCIRIPMISEARSLNLSNSVAILAYEALRQQGFPGLLGTGSMAQG